MNEPTFFAEVVFFVNDVPHHPPIGDEEAEELVEQLRSGFDARLADSALKDRFELRLLGWERGCLLVSFGLFLTVSTVVYKGVKDYPDLRKGAIQLATDIGSAYRYLKGPRARHRAVLYRIDFEGESRRRRLPNRSRRP